MNTHDICDTTNPFLPAAEDVLGALRIEAPWLFDDPDAPVVPGKRTRSHAKACPARAAEEDVCVIVHGEVDEAFLSRKIEIGASADGAQTKSGRWKVWKTDIRGFLNKFLEHKVGEKDGHCFLQGPPLDGKRQASAIPHMDLLSLDLDTGESIESIIERVKALGLFALIYTTYSHMKPVTDVKRDAVIKWSGVEDPNPSLEAVKGYLLEVKRYQPWVLEDARLVETKHTAEGVKIFIEHKPMPKFRVVLVLENRFTVLDRAAKQSDAIREWKERYAGASRLLGASFDRSCVDPSRLFYLPRHPRGAAEWRIEVVAGRPLDLDRDVDRVTEADLRAAGKNEFEIAAEKVAGKAGSYVTDNLLPFFAKYGDRFELETWLLEVDPENDRGSRPNGPGRTHRCPNDDSHSNAGDENDQGFFCVNGGATDTGQCVAHCQHDACADLDRVNFVDLMCQAVGTTDAMDLKRWVPELVGENEAQDEDEEKTSEDPATESKPQPIKTLEAAKQAIKELAQGDAEGGITLARCIGMSGFSGGELGILVKQLAARSGLKQPDVKAEFKVGKGLAQTGGDDPTHYDDDTLKELAKLNRRYALAGLGGKVRVLENPDQRGAPPRLWEVEAWKIKMANRKVAVANKDGDVSWSPISKEWIEWSERRTFDDVVFEPEASKVPEGAYNMWSGLTVTGRKGDWSLLRAHMLDNICQGDEANFAFLMTWIAQIYQQPGRKLGTAVVVKGSKGTGKSAFFEWVMKPLGAHAMTVSQKSHITGNFNAHQTGKILLLCEEAFWAGDTAAGNALKSLITHDKMALERKGVDVIEVSNYVRLAMLSNEDWVVPAGFPDDERRFFVLECGDARKNDTAFFASIQKQMESGGSEAMVYDLMHWTPPYEEGWNVLRRAPATVWLGEQATEGLPVWAQFFRRLVTDGEIDLRNRPEGLQPISLNEDDDNYLVLADLRWAYERTIERDPAGRHKVGNDQLFDKMCLEWLQADPVAVVKINPNNYFSGDALRCVRCPPLEKIRRTLTVSKGLTFAATVTQDGGAAVVGEQVDQFFLDLIETGKAGDLQLFDEENETAGCRFRAGKNRVSKKVFRSVYESHVRGLGEQADAFASQRVMLAKVRRFLQVGGDGQERIGGSSVPVYLVPPLATLRGG